MGSVNKVMLIGNLGADPDVRDTAAGKMVATLSIATSESYTDRDGVRQEKTEWHRVVVWGKLAELAQRYLQKGRKVFVEGRLQTRSWDDAQSGQKRYATEVVASELVFLDTGKGGGEERAPAPAERPSSRPSGNAYGSRSSAPSKPAGPAIPASDPGFFDNDVPF